MNDVVCLMPYSDRLFVDLHCHSTCSDGTLPPRVLARRAKQAGLSAFVLTDHDTAAGCAEAAAVAAELGIDFLPGIELSCDYPRPGTLHLLGYGIDPASPSLADLSRRMVAGRNERNERIVTALQKLGVRIDMDEVRQVAKGEVIGRPHIAEALLRKRIVSHRGEAFTRYLGNGGLAFEDRDQLTPAQAIAAVHAAGGLAVVAHPFQLRKENYAQLRGAIKHLADQGLDGIETLHSDHRDSLVAELEEIARELGLLVTGGSDFHGSNKPHIKLGRAGRRRIPRERYDALKAALAARGASKSA
ncbi:MAG: PHP domain-containing protein [Phycisphaerae bacterium]